MALTGKNAGAVKKWSGGEMWVKQVNADGTDLTTTPDTFKSLGYISDGKFLDQTETEEYQDETGDVIATNETKRTVTVEALLMQSSKEILDFLGRECRGKYYALYRYEGVTSNNHLELFFPLVQITPQIQLEAGTKRPPFKATVLKAPAEITIATAGMPSVKKTAASVVIAKDDYYQIIETPLT